MTLLIYLADLTHIGKGSAIATESFPLNIGLIGSYAKKIFGDRVKIELFKHPHELLSAIDKTPPDILGCSNYTWNSNLAYYFTSKVKLASPDTLTIWGGTNYPFDAISQEKFLRKRPDLDLHVFYEGEQAFAVILERVLQNGAASLLTTPIAGCQFIDPKNSAFVSGPALPRQKNLDEIPSPYVSGMLDKFFDGVFTPLVETARGCPFRCNFCNAGDLYFNKVNKFSDEYVHNELSYIAKKASECGGGHVTFADNNFGMIPRDATTTEVVHALQKKYNWPQTMTVWTGKNAKERVIDFTHLLQDTIRISMSVQSMDSEVLKNVSRDNIKLDHYRSIAADLNQQGRKQHAEVVMPLPGETLKSHISGLNELLDTKLSNIQSHTLQMLHGTPYKDDPKYVEEYGYQTKFRLVPLDFSLIGEDRVFDVEEVGIETNSFPFEDYVTAREYLLTLDICFSTGVFQPLLRHAADHGVTVSSLINTVFEGRQNYGGAIQEIFASFVADTKGELWNNEEELVAYYSKPVNFEKLVAGEVGGNVLFKHRVWILAQAIEEWVGITFKAAKALYEKAQVADSALRELECLMAFVSGTVSKSFSPDSLESIVEKTVNHDVITWLESPDIHPLTEFSSPQPITVQFKFSDRDKKILSDAFTRYGHDVGGLVKLIQRVVTVPFRTPLTNAEIVPNTIQESSLSGGTMSPGNFSL
jgi:radical SAM superfamily enzyme YgiQ (UPF0313 family)